MSQSTERIVRDLTDSQVVGVVKEFFSEVFTQIPYEEVRLNSETVANLDSLVRLDGETLECPLSAAESARLGRLVLERFARDPELSPLVDKACEKVKSSDEMFVDVLLALGLIVNLTLLVATTEVQVKKESDGTTTWKLTKKKASPELVKAVIDPVVGAAKSFGLGGGAATGVAAASQ